MLAAQFEEHRSHLRVVAQRMLGSVSEADDAMQETWVRISRDDTSDIDSFGGWLTTVAARVCVDRLRSRRSRRDESSGVRSSDVVGGIDRSIDPEVDTLLADSVGPALLVALETRTPTEHFAFVLHDLFAIRFEAIARVVGCSPAAAEQYASRARRRVQGNPGFGQHQA